MYVYYFNAISAVIYRLIFPGKKNDKMFLFVVCLQMFIILSIRADTFGADALAYIRMYDIAKGFSLRDILENWSFFQVFPLLPYAESGYVFMNWICTQLGLSYHAYIMILAFVDCYCMYIFLREFSYSPLLGTLMFQTATLSWIFILRRTMAMNFVFLSFIALKKKQYLRSVILLIIAVTMHRIAFAFIFYPLLSRIKITKRLFRIAIIVFIAGTVFSAVDVELVYIIFDSLGKGGYINFNSGFTGLRLAGLILTTIAFWGIYVSVDFKQFETPENSVLGAMLFIVILYLTVLATASGLGNIVVWFILFTFILATNIVVGYKDRTTRVVLWTAAFMFILFWTYRWIDGLSQSVWGQGVIRFMTVWD